jgi:hypothetical protein
MLLKELLNMKEKNTNVGVLVKKILSVLSFIVMTVLAYKTTRTFPEVTSVFAILSIITLVSAVLVGKSGKLMNFLFEDLEDLPRGTRLSLTGLFLYVIMLFIVSYGIVFIPTIVATICMGGLILLGLVCFFY